MRTGEVSDRGHDDEKNVNWCATNAVLDWRTECAVVGAKSEREEIGEMKAARRGHGGCRFYSTERHVGQRL